MVGYLLKISWWRSRKNILVEGNSVQDAVMQSFETYGNSTEKRAKLADNFNVVLISCRKIMRVWGSINKHLMGKYGIQRASVVASLLLWKVRHRGEAKWICNCLCSRAPKTFECSVLASLYMKVRDLVGKISRVLKQGMKTSRWKAFKMFALQYTQDSLGLQRWPNLFNRC